MQQELNTIIDMKFLVQHHGACDHGILIMIVLVTMAF